MRNRNLWRAAVLLLVMFTTGVHAQKAKREPVKHEKEVRDIVAFFQFMLNTLGDAQSSARDKDVLVTESFTKIFRDAKVQVEDDLDPERKVITNKDAPAYLKDVDFFFRNVKFEFDIEDIQSAGAAGGNLFYKVTLKRNLKGTTIDGEAVNNTIPRFIEINFDSKNQDLKIVSVYTNQFNEKTALLSWWNELSYEWQNIFRQKVNLTSDSVQLSDIKTIATIDTLDLSRNPYIQTIEPLSLLQNLKVLRLSQTQIIDLSPLRNLTELVELDLSQTKVADLSPLRYSGRLSSLNLNHTAVKDISVFEKLISLSNVEMRATQVTDFSPLAHLSEVEVLNLSATPLTDLNPIDSLSKIKLLDIANTRVSGLVPIQSFQNITHLSIDSTLITDLAPVASMQSLQVLHMNHTAISDLDPLKNLLQLEKIYCDHTGINNQVAKAFMTSNPKVLVIFETEDLRGWWDNLPSVWRDVLSRAARIGYSPTKEELARVTNLDSVNFTRYVSIRDLEPLRKLEKLKVVIADQSGITDLSPLKTHVDIRTLDISDTQVADLSPVRSFNKLKVLKADRTKITNIDTLSNIKSLQKIYVDDTALTDEQVQEFLVSSPNCLVVYNTGELETWWSGLSEDWRQIFEMQVKIATKPSRESLHALVELEKLQFSDVQVTDLSALQPFLRLKELRFTGTAIRDLSPLAKNSTLQTLYINDNPIGELAPVSQLKDLVDLDISNTPADDLAPLEELQNLTRLNCSGTQVKKLDALKKAKFLEYLDCANTNVRSLAPVVKLPLKTLKCYNTKVSKAQIKSFRKQNPSCNVVYY